MQSYSCTSIPQECPIILQIYFDIFFYNLEIKLIIFVQNVYCPDECNSVHREPGTCSGTAGKP